MKRLFKSILAAVFLCTATLAFAQESEAVKHVAQGTILHAWCWSFNTIKDNMQQIADSGFTAVQTSPINTCRIGEYGDLNFWSNDNTGKWYYHYQPTDWKIGNYQLGTRDEFKAMCDEAKKYNITVIVDVVPNHTTQVSKFSQKELAPLFEAVGGQDKLYHKHGLEFNKNWDSRNELTNKMIGGLPDVNTENPDFQAYFMAFMNDAINCGAGGFRFDTAKHIGLPDDPKDNPELENNFWPIFTGKEAIRGVMLKDAENLFEYGEVLQAQSDRIDDYQKYLRTTASIYGSDLRFALNFDNLTVSRISDYKVTGVDPSRLVTWIESHDTYANEGASARMNNFRLRVGYAVITARKDGTPLFFSRPQGAEATQFPGASKIGDIGNDQFKHPEVAAVNKFRTAMIGEDENMFNGESKSQLVIERGSKGAVIFNMAEKASPLKAQVKLADGTYTDHANPKKKYTVKGGILNMKIPAKSIVVLY